VFERYTETARRSVFVARYEATQFGSGYIETEHLLLGILRTDGPLALRLLKAPEKIEAVREQIEKQAARGDKPSTSVDMPLSQECKRALAYAGQESEKLHQKHIGAEHLLLGIVRQETCLAAKILLAFGIAPQQLKEEVARSAQVPPPKLAPAAPLIENVRDLTAAARSGGVPPLVGRESELERAIHILSRRTRNNPVLIGEAGIGKNAIVQGLAQRIVDGDVPPVLADRAILAIDAGSLIAPNRGSQLPAISGSNAILYVQGLFDLAAKGSGWGVMEAIHILEPHLAEGRLQCIATGSPFGLRMTLERAETLARHFEVVAVLPPSEQEAIRIVAGVKPQYETFHGVTITDEAVEAAVFASRWFLRHRHLPDRAIDLIDDAGARVKLRRETEPREMAEIRRRIRLITRQMENAIANHQFDKARFYGDEERRELQSLQQLSDQLKQDPPSNNVTADDLVEAVAARAGVPVASVRSVLTLRDVGQLELIAKGLSMQIPAGHAWAEGLSAYLASCSGEEAEKLADAIRSVKAKYQKNPEAGSKP
jgi:ATP-dependent Clp protease ATP-binding subunit ClpC